MTCGGGEVFQKCVLCQVGGCGDKKPIVITQIEDIYLVKSHSKLFVHLCISFYQKK